MKSLYAKSSVVIVLNFLIIISMLPIPSFAILPKIPSGTGGYYVIPFGTAFITAIFNNTQVCADADKNLVCTSGEITTLNAGEYMSTTANIIFTDKPVSVTYMPFGLNGCGNSGTYTYGLIHLPPSGELLKKYIIFSEPYVRIVAVKPYTTIVNHTYPNGTLISTYTLNNIAEYITLNNPSDGTFIESDKPIFVFEEARGGYQAADYAYIPNYAGTKFYIDGRHGTIYITPLQNNTNVWVDENRDGITDSTYTLYSGDVLSLSGLSVGTEITADKPIVMVSKISSFVWNGHNYINSSYLGSEYVLPKLPSCQEAYINPIQYSTDVEIYDVSGNVVATYNLTVPSDYVKPSYGVGYKIKSDKPVIVTVHATTSNGAWPGDTYILHPLSPSTIIKTPGMIALNEYGTIKVRFFNPTSETLYNISIDTYSHKNFTLVGDTGVVNITVYKKNASTDSVIAQSFMQKSYSLSGDENVFTVSYADSSLLSSLKTDEYIELEFEVMANSPGYYSFRAESTWKATYWA